jgi:predicted transcriptional regulator
MKLRYLKLSGDVLPELQFQRDDSHPWEAVPVVDAASIAEAERFHKVVSKVAVELGKTPLDVAKTIEAYNLHAINTPV